MNGQNLSYFTMAGLMLSCCWAAPSQATSGWDGMAPVCIKAFAAPDKSDAKKLLSCADTFSAEARTDNLSGADKSTIEKGLRWMYDNGESPAPAVARDGLTRLGIKMPAKGSATTAKSNGTNVVAAEAQRKKYDPPEAKTADAQAADKMAKEAVAKFVSKKKWTDGAKQLEKALEKNPRGEYILYNLACTLANMEGKQDKADEYLQDLADLGTEDATKRLVKARTDPDLEPMRDNSDFKRITGYARIQVVNTIGTPGDKGVENIQKLLAKLEHRKADEADVDKPQEFCVVQFKPHAKALAGLVSDLLKSPVKLDEIKEGKYDLIIRWGSKVEDGKAISLGPDTGDEAIADARKKQNKVLAQPDAALNKVNKVLNTPDHAYNEGQAAISRTETSVKKAQGAVDKVKGLGEKLNKL